MCMYMYIYIYINTTALWVTLIASVREQPLGLPWLCNSSNRYTSTSNSSTDTNDSNYSTSSSSSTTTTTTNKASEPRAA